MAGGIFSVPIFFIVFRETLEAAIIISVLLGLVEQIVRDDSADGGARVFITEKTGRPAQSALPELHQSSSASNSSSSDEDERVQMRRLVRRLRVQVSGGTGENASSPKTLGTWHSSSSKVPSRHPGTVMYSASFSSLYTHTHTHTLTSTADADLSWRCAWLACRFGDWRGLHCSLVHGGVKLVGQVRGTLGGCILHSRFPYHPCHGYYNAQIRSRKGKMESQIDACIRSKNEKHDRRRRNERRSSRRQNWSMDSVCSTVYYCVARGYGSRRLRRRCLVGSVSTIYPHRCYRRNRLRIDLRILDLRVCESNQCVPSYHR